MSIIVTAFAAATCLLLQTSPFNSWCGRVRRTCPQLINCSAESPIVSTHSFRNSAGDEVNILGRQSSESNMRVPVPADLTSGTLQQEGKCSAETIALQLCSYLSVHGHWRTWTCLCFWLCSMSKDHMLETIGSTLHIIPTLSLCLPFDSHPRSQNLDSTAFRLLYQVQPRCVP